MGNTFYQNVFLDISLLWFSLLHKVGIYRHFVIIEMDIASEAIPNGGELNERQTETLGDSAVNG